MATRRLRMRYMAGGAGSVLLCVVFGALAWRFYLEWRTEARPAAARARGEPITLVELDAFYPAVPEAENAAQVYLKANIPTEDGGAFENVQIPILGTWKLPAAYEPIPPDILATCDAVINNNAEALRALHEAARMPAARFPVDLRAGLTRPADHLRQMHAVAHFLEFEAIIAAEHQQKEQAVEAICACLRAGEALRTVPELMTQAACTHFSKIAQPAAERVVSRTHLTDGQLARLVEALLATEDFEAEWRAMIGERCDLLAYFDDSDPNIVNMWMGSDRFRPIRLAVGHLYSLSGMKAADWRSCFDLETKLIESAHLPYHERLKADMAIQDEIDSLPATRPRTKLLVQKAGYAYPFIRYAAQIRTAAVALAVERYRCAQGTLPETLEALTPVYINEVPLDPYSGGPLHLARTERGFIVYSFGLNGVDDGGSEELDENAGNRLHPSWNWRELLDVAFRVER